MSRRHEFDQHFLANTQLVAELIGHSSIRKTDLVYDFGAGSGVIAAVLASRGCEVVAVETEPFSLQKLRSNVGALANVMIVQEDMLQTALPKTAYKVFSNIPFSLSSKLVNRLTTADLAPDEIYLIVQRQFARKLTFGAHFTSMLGVQISPWWQVRIRKPLKRSDFTPPPNVDTDLLEVKKRQQPALESEELEDWWQFVERCFSRQKYFGEISSYEVSGHMKKPSELNLDEWLGLFEQNKHKAIARKQNSATIRTWYKRKPRPRSQQAKRPQNAARKKLSKKR